MSNANHEEVEMRAIAAMTASEVRAALQQFGLRPFEHLPLALSRLRASGENRPGTTTRLIEQPKEAQSFVTVIPNSETARKRARNVPARAITRWQFQQLKNAWDTFAFRRVALASVVMVFVAFLASLMLERRVTANHPKLSTVTAAPDLVSSNVVIGDFKGDEKKLIYIHMTALLTPRCTKAFERANLRSPLEVVTREGVVVLPAKDLYKYSAERLGLTREETLLAYRDEFSSGQAQSGAVPSMLHGVRLTTDGRARVFLHDTAFLGESVIFNRLSLTDVLTHEFIHLGGQPPTPGWFFQHDLAGFEHLEETMGACR